MVNVFSLNHDFLFLHIFPYSHMFTSIMLPKCINLKTMGIMSNSAFVPPNKKFNFPEIYLNLSF